MRYLSSLYKQQKPLTISSVFLTLIVTSLVLLAASSANAQATITNDRGAVNDRRIEVKEAMIAKRAELASTTAARREAFSLQRTERQSAFEERKASLEEKRAALASTTAARKAALAEKVQTRIIQIGEKASATLNRAINTLQNFSSDLRNRTNTVADNDIDVNPVLALLDEVDGLLSDAKIALDGIDINVQYVATSDNPRADWADARAQFTEVRDLLKQARDLLKEALAELKNVVRETGFGSGVSAAVRNDNANNTSTTSNDTTNN